MKIIQLNTWSNKLSSEILKLFEQEKPDIVALQEVISASRGAKILDTIEEIVEKYPFESKFYTPLVEFGFMHTTVRRGNMIAANYPMIETGETWTHGSFQKDFDYVDSGGYNAARNFIHATIKTPQGIVNVLTLHGYHIAEHKNGNEETMKACKQLIEYAATLPGAVIITGDFNLAPSSESIQYINHSFKNLSTEYDFKTTRNYLTSKTEVYDYIFVNDKITVHDMYMADTIASDHNALVLDFDIV